MKLSDLSEEERQFLDAYRRLPSAAHPAVHRAMLRLANDVPEWKVRQAFRVECYAAGVTPPCDR